jgi:hypothetical protein
MHVNIKIKVVYDDASIDVNRVKDNLIHNIDESIQCGLLTPTNTEIVDEYEVALDE